MQALEENWISGAILDVFETEPLPIDSALWNLSNVSNINSESIKRPLLIVGVHNAPYSGK